MDTNQAILFLGLKKGFSKNDLKTAYRNLCFKWHPDKNVEATDEDKKIASDNFKKVQQAYDVLLKRNCQEFKPLHSSNFSQETSPIFGNVFNEDIRYNFNQGFAHFSNQEFGQQFINPRNFHNVNSLNANFEQNNFVKSVQTSTVMNNGTRTTRIITKINGKVVKDEFIS